jgi:alpha-beta hydrolase superfamily lysophospholipase
MRPKKLVTSRERLLKFVEEKRRLVGAVVDTGSNGKLRFLLWSLRPLRGSGGYRIAVDHVTIHYQTFGSGRPVLVLHGGLGALVDMRYQIESLAKNHHVIAPDSREQGRSTDSAAPLSYAEMADDMRALLDHLAICQADVVGWSDGGIVGLTLAPRYPSRTAGGDWGKF